MTWPASPSPRRCAHPSWTLIHNRVIYVRVLDITACMHTCIHTFRPTYIHLELKHYYLHTYIHECIYFKSSVKFIWLLMYVCIVYSIHTYIHTHKKTFDLSCYGEILTHLILRARQEKMRILFAPITNKYSTKIKTICNIIYHTYVQYVCVCTYAEV